MTRMDWTGPRATCTHVPSFTQDKYAGPQCDNRGRSVDTTPSLIWDLLKCFCMNHRSYWCHRGLVSWILDSARASDGLGFWFVFFGRTLRLHNKLQTKKTICIYISFPKVGSWFRSCRDVNCFFIFVSSGDGRSADQNRDQPRQQQRGQRQM